VSVLGRRTESWRSIARSTYESWRSHRTVRLGAGLAYYGLFAVVPMLTVSVAIAGVVIKDADIESWLTDVLSDLVDGDASEVATSITASLDTTKTFAGLGIVGLASLVLASSLVFVALQDAFDTIWELPVRSGAGNTLRRRALAFGVVLLGGAVLVANFAISAVSSLVRNLAPGDSGVLEVAADAVAVLGSWALVAAILSFLFHFLTRADVSWKASLAGGVVTASAMTGGNRLVGEYLNRWGVSSLAGAAGAVLVVLFWVYALAQITLVGAEITRSLDLALRGRPKPEHG
jgi:membrane protein